MFYKTLTVSTFILLVWASMQNSGLQQSLATMGKQQARLTAGLDELQQQLLQNQQLIKAQQEQLATLSVASAGAADGKTDAKAKAKPKPPPKKTAKEVIPELAKMLNDAKAAQKKKDMKKAEELLNNFKKALWGIRDDKSIDKKTALATVGAVDSVLKKWKAKDIAFSTDALEKRFYKLQGKEPPKKPAAGKTDNKANPGNKKPDAAKKPPADKTKKPEAKKPSDDKNKNKPPAKESKPAPGKPDIQATVATLQNKLKTVNEALKIKDLKKAGKVLGEFKQTVWKIRKHEKIKEATALSIVGSVDSVSKKWAGGDNTAGIAAIEDKMKRLQKK